MALLDLQGLEGSRSSLPDDQSISSLSVTNCSGASLTVCS